MSRFQLQNASPFHTQPTGHDCDARRAAQRSTWEIFTLVFYPVWDEILNQSLPCLVFSSPLLNLKNVHAVRLFPAVFPPDSRQGKLQICDLEGRRVAPTSCGAIEASLLAVSPRRGPGRVKTRDVDSVRHVALALTAPTFRLVGATRRRAEPTPPLGALVSR